MTATQDFLIQDHRPVAKDVYELMLAGDTSPLTAPGQFVNIALPGFYLRRPISVCDWAPGMLRLIYKVVGEGTAALAEYRPGEALDLLLPLGNGFSVPQGVKAPLLIGGGVGTPPLYGLARALVNRGLAPTVVLGFRGREDLFLEEDFRALGCRVAVATQDGSRGTAGFVTDVPALGEDGHDYYFTCGPQGMLKAVHSTLAIPGQLSFEERMACGFGACMGCSCQTLYGSKRICKDGPVLHSGEVVWGGAQ